MLTGTGAAGAYHAGVLRALDEAGVRIDVVAGRGVGAVSALFAAIDAGRRLTDDGGLWRQPAVGRLYGWRWPWRVVVWCVVGAVAVLLAPIAVLALGAIVYPAALVVQVFSPVVSDRLASGYVAWLAGLFSPAWVSLVVPRAIAALLLAAVAALAVGALTAPSAGRRRRGHPLWRAFGAPFDASSAASWCEAGFWQAIRGAAPIQIPRRPALSQRYSDLLGENLGQPGYRELLFTVHDLDARRDLVFAALGSGHRTSFFDVPVGTGSGSRQMELIDLAGTGRDLVFEALAGALAPPFITEPHPMAFPVESAWRGETHRLQDRPGAIVRLLEELSAAGVEQVILVSADPSLEGPHGLTPGRLDPRSRLGEILAGAEAASVRDALTLLFDRFSSLFLIQPPHNAVGPFDLHGTYDDRSERQSTVGELIERGFHDAHAQFIAPMVGGVVPEHELRVSAAAHATQAPVDL